MIDLAPTFDDTYRANGLVADLLDNLLTDPFSNGNNFRKRNSSNVKLIEEAKRYIIQFPVPGYNRHTLILEIDGNNLLVRGNKWLSNQLFQTDTELSEKYFQLYFYSLPQDANTDHVKAICRNGLLEVYVAKHRTSNKPKVIRVTNGNIVYRKWRQGISLWSKLKQNIKFKLGKKIASAFPNK